MKNTLKFLPVLIALLLAACSKQEQEPAAASQSTAPATPPPPAPAPAAAVGAAQKAADTLVTDGQKAAGELKASAQSAANQATNAAGAATDSGAQVMTALRQAKTLFNEKKYTEALAALAQLSPSTLSADQQSMVAQLKSQIQNAMAGQAANEGLKSVGGLLNKKN